MQAKSASHTIEVLDSQTSINALEAEIDESFDRDQQLTRWEVRNNAGKLPRVVHVLRDDINRLIALSITTIDIENHRAEIAWRIVALDFQGLGLIQAVHKAELQYLKDLGIKEIATVAATTNGERSFTKLGFSSPDRMNPDHMVLNLTGTDQSRQAPKLASYPKTPVWP